MEWFHLGDLLAMLMNYIGARWFNDRATPMDLEGFPQKKSDTPKIDLDSNELLNLACFIGYLLWSSPSWALEHMSVYNQLVRKCMD